MTSVAHQSTHDWRLRLPEPVGDALAWFAAFAGFLGMTFWASRFTPEDPGVPLIWPATGLALALAYRFGYGMLVPVFVACISIHMLLGVPLPQAALLASGILLGAVAGCWMLQRFAVRKTLERTRDVLLLFAIGVGASALISGFTSALTMVGVSSGLPQVFGVCWMADTAGMLLFAPALLAFAGADADASTDWRSGLLILLPVVVAGAAFGVGLDLLVALPLSYLIFPAVILVALLLPPGAVALSVALVAVIAVSCTAAGKGPFAQMGMQPDLMSLYAQLFLLQLTGLLLAAVRCERLDAERREHSHARTLARIGRLNAMSAMAAGLAHEINQPLCAISSYSQTARRLLDRGASAESLGPALDRIRDGTERASDIVRRARRFLGDPDRRRQAQDLRRLIRDAVSLIRPELRRNAVRLDLSLPATPLYSLVDGLELQQVLINLMQNAEEAILEAGRGPAERWIRVSASVVAGDREICVRVTDRGPGLGQVDVASLFEPLVSHRAGGTGLGLAIARSIVESHGGRLTAKSEAGAGACFSLTLPLVQCPAGSETRGNDS